MRAYFKGVAVFNKDKAPCYINLGPGLNIITGVSKKGKSAILKIIDWCLGSQNFLIPKGVITNFAEIYAVIINTDRGDILIARKGEHHSNFFLVQIVNVESISDLSYADFDEESFVNKKCAFEKVEDLFNFKIVNNLFSIQFEENTGKSAIRNLIPFMLQPQRIIANDTELFYEKPNSSYFPVLAGWIGQEYYNTHNELNKLNNEYPKKKSEIEKQQEENDLLERSFRNSFWKYYNLIGKEFNKNWTTLDLLNELVTFSEVKFDQVVSDSAYTQLKELNENINTIDSELSKIEIQLTNISKSKSLGNRYKDFLIKYEARKEYKALNDKYICPVCNQPNFELGTVSQEVRKAHKWLENELKSVPATVGKFDGHIKSFEDQKKTLLTQRKEYVEQFNKIKMTVEQISKGKSAIDEIHKAKIEVEQEASFMQRKMHKIDYNAIQKMQDRIDELTGIKETFRVTEKYQEAKVYIETKMNEIVRELDFEFQPPSLNFELDHNNKLDVYKLYHNVEGVEKRYLNQIGSASNSLACHIGLFLSFLHYFSSRASRVPTILFFDQPSQVYFPSGKKDIEKDEDTMKVAKIYDTLIKTISEINDEWKFEPQIIVADHIRDLGPNVNLLEKYFRADWRDNSDGFISES